MSERGPGSDDPGVVETVAVHAEDVVTTAEARLRSDEDAVLRLTPPFHARMRARIHIRQRRAGDGGDGPTPVYVLPGALLAEDCPSYPEPHETAAEVAADGDPDPDRHHDHHCAVVDRWRSEAAGSIRDRVTVAHGDRTLSFGVTALGDR
ncbi:hypothetical protein GJ629_08560 [Halapricum sp. CBA1109]|uniref:hypothetical protein n=1 Tax=Halapricum sp. CBA1109 TaxID=2668068 RepID=UPI0012FBE028|nr:hypothetical protein [Halapricum sp. CBA1109]MUV89939.1 hypothetical protein [Halapricum sp. CBA1109]